MAFGGPGVHPVRGDLAEIAEAIVPVMAALSRLRHELDAAGAPLAGTYIEGAYDALSFAIDAAMWAAVRYRGTEDGAWIGTIQLRLERDGEGVYADLRNPVSVAPPAAAGRSLGADLTGSASVIEVLRKDEVATGLMAAALAHSDWMHVASGEVFIGDPLSARAVVATIAGRTSFPTWTRRQMGGLIHRESADALAALGWRRMTGAALPTA